MVIWRRGCEILWILALSVESPAIAQDGIYSATRSQQESNTELRRSKSLYQCQENPATGEKNCHQDWALQNSNEVMALRQAQLDTMVSDLKKAKQGNEAERNKILQGYRRERQCTDTDSFDSCYDRMMRSISAQTLEIRSNILRQDQARLEIIDHLDEKVRSGKRIEEGTQEPKAANIQVGKAKTTFEVIEAQRKEKSPNNASDPNRRPPQCEENPFIPCTVVYGQSRSMRNGSQDTDPSRANLLQGQVDVRAADVKVLPTATPESAASNTVYVPQEGMSPDRRLTAAVQSQLNSKNGNFSKKAYAEDLAIAEAAKKAIDVEEKKAKVYLSNPRDGESPSWRAFHELMDSLQAQREQEKKKGIEKNNYWALKLEPETNSNGSKKSINNNELTPESVLESTGFMPAKKRP